MNYCCIYVFDHFWIPEKHDNVQEAKIHKVSHTIF